MQIRSKLSSHPLLSDVILIETSRGRRRNIGRQAVVTKINRIQGSGNRWREDERLTSWDIGTRNLHENHAGKVAALTTWLSRWRSGLAKINILILQSTRSRHLNSFVTINKQLTGHCRHLQVNTIGIPQRHPGIHAQAQTILGGCPRSQLLVADIVIHVSLRQERGNIWLCEWGERHRALVGSVIETVSIVCRRWIFPSFRSYLIHRLPIKTIGLGEQKPFSEDPESRRNFFVARRVPIKPSQPSHFFIDWSYQEIFIIKPLIVGRFRTKIRNAAVTQNVGSQITLESPVTNIGQNSPRVSCDIVEVVLDRLFVPWVNQGHRIQRDQLGRFVFNNVSNAIDNRSLDILSINQSLDSPPFSINHLLTVSVSHGDCRLRAKGTNPKPITTQIAVISSAIWQQLFFLSGHPLHENLIIQIIH